MSLPIRAAAFCLSLSCLSVFPAAAEINLTGKVVGTDGKGIAGVRVGLKHLTFYAFTDAEGRYKLDAASLRVPDRSRASAPGAPALKAGAVSFSVPVDGAHVDIRAFDLFGRPAGVLHTGPLAAGGYALKLPAASAGTILFVRATIAGRRHVLRHFPASLKAQSGPASAQATPPALSKRSAAEYDTLTVSKEGYSPDYKRINSFTGTHDFFLGQPEAFWGDPAALPAAKLAMIYKFVNRTNGKFLDKDIHWKFTGFKLGTQEPIPVQSGNLADNPTLDLPMHHAGRVTFHLGSPTGEYNDFMEQTMDNLGWHGNTTRVDAYGVPMAMRLLCDDARPAGAPWGKEQLLGEKYEVFFLGREKFFQRYLASVPAEFQHNADASAKRLRITAPGKGDLLFNPGQKYADYFTPYFKELGLSGPKVTTQFAFACQDEFFNEKADLCGAVNRHVAHLPKEQWRNPEFFYQKAPANFYAKFFHDYSFSEKAYGFAYDDAAEMAAFAECAKPKTLQIAIGW